MNFLLKLNKMFNKKKIEKLEYDNKKLRAWYKKEEEKLSNKITSLEGINKLLNNNIKALKNELEPLQEELKSQKTISGNLNQGNELLYKKLERYETQLKSNIKRASDYFDNLLNNKIWCLIGNKVFKCIVVKVLFAMYSDRVEKIVFIEHPTTNEIVEIKNFYKTKKELINNL